MSSIRLLLKARTWNYSGCANVELEKMCQHGNRGDVEEGFPEAAGWKRDLKKRPVGVFQETQEAMAPEPSG